MASEQNQHSALVAKAEEIVGAIRSYSDFNGIEAADVIEGLVELLGAAERRANGMWNGKPVEYWERIEEQLGGLEISRDAWRSDAEVFQDERDELKEQFDAAQRENHEWNAAYGRLLQLLYRADGQLELENEKHPNHNITELRRDIAAEAKKNA